MHNILLTGFAPFDHEITNPSWETAKEFSGKKILDHTIHVAQLPCEFGVALRDLRNQIEQLKPQLVICLGQAGGRSEITVERVAINVDDARIPDNIGAQPIDQAIVEGGPAAYFSTLPIKAITHTLRENGIPADVSQSAGTYVCNHVFYGLMHLASQNREILRAGFIHIPYLPSQACLHPGSASMSQSMMEKAVQLIVEECISRKDDLKMGAGRIY
ncbi:MAG: pyroglutamyl-peptidase I [Undibacterium sp.]|nr:pyroglutamyl-peptidase I [Undibacterium sp.]